MALLGGIGKLAQRARNLARSHPDQVRKAVDQAENVLDKRTGRKHSGQIDSVGDKVTDFLAPDAPKENPPAR
ncbi:MAG: antitoxin [Jatrophihabitantaceae bacterium]